MYSGVLLQFENGLIVGNGAGATVRPPSELKIKQSDIDNGSERSSSGYLNRNRVRGGTTAVYTVECVWNRLTWAELCAVIGASNASEFTLTFIDPSSSTVGGTTTRQMYRDANMEYDLVHIFNEQEAYWSTTMTFIEF